MVVAGSCEHERCHVVDSRFHGAGFAPAATRAIFCDVCRLERWLQVEVALAAAQGELGILPDGVAQAIARAAKAGTIDLARVASGVRETTHSLVPLLAELRRACDHHAREFIHHGATTQDIQDTAQSLEMRAVLDAAELAISRLLASLRPLAVEHRTSTMVGRTHAVPALPITFGLKIASWIDELLRHRERIAQARPRLLVAQLFGGTGTMSALGGQSMVLLERFAARLGLEVPRIGWHVARDRVCEFVSLLAMAAATSARIADELRTLCRPEIGEVVLGWSAEQIGSSTMPHKRNPEDCEQVVTLARLARAQVPLALDSMVLEHERDYRGMRLEWCAVADVSHYAVGALELLGRIVQGLSVASERMQRNVRAHADALCTERLVFALAPAVGKERAYQLVFDACHRALDRHQPLRSEMVECPEIMAHIGSADRLDSLLDPDEYRGASGELVDRVLRALDQEV